MDTPKLHTRQHWWLDVVKDYDCEIRYHLSKANIVADALSQKTTSTPMKGIFLKMTMITPVLEMFKQAQSEATNEESLNSERIVRQILSFDIDSRGLLTLYGKI